MLIEFGNKVNRCTVNFDHVRKVEIDVSTIVLRDSKERVIAREYCGTQHQAKKRVAEINATLAGGTPRRKIIRRDQ